MLKSKFETYKSFPYVAWAVFILFAIFVYSITMKLSAVAVELETYSENLTGKVTQNVGQIEDFEN